MNRLCWVSSLVFLLLAVILAYLLVVPGDTRPSSDGRVAIVMSGSERDMVLGEMRAFLEAVQTVTQGVVDNDLKGMVAAARRVGGEAQHGAPASLVAKLPLEFKKLGFDTHARFDQLAQNATDLGDTADALTELAELLQNCTACHATYRIEVENP